MDDAVSRQGKNRRNHHNSTDPRSCRRKFYAAQYNLASNAFRFNGGTNTLTRAHKLHRVPAFLQAKAKDLRRAKAKLLQLYKHEQCAAARGDANTISADLRNIRCSRATAERRYVGCLISYYREGNEMTTAQASQLQENFTRKTMGKNGNLVGPPSRDYLMSLYPREVN
jgi:hypothetical protein